MVDATASQSTIRRSLGDLPAAETLLMKEVNFMRAALMALALLPALVADVGAVQFGLPSPVVPNGLGMNTHWNNASNNSPSAAISLFAASGVGFNRVDMKWSDIELSPNSYTFGNSLLGLRFRVRRCAASGIRNLFILDPNSAMTMYGSDATTSAWQTAFTNYAAAVAAHYAGDGNIYEICNEPKNQTNGLQTASVYTAVAAKVYSAMKGADPTCTILAGSTPNINSDGQTWLKSCIRDGLLNDCDAVSVHPYNGTDAPELFPTRYAAVTALMPRYGGKTLPLVTSEWGVTTTDPGITPQVQGDYLGILPGQPQPTYSTLHRLRLSGQQHRLAQQARQLWRGEVGPHAEAGL